MDELSTPLHAASMHRTLVSFIEVELALLHGAEAFKIALCGAAQRSECFGGKLELIQPHMAQRPVLRGEVGARALRVRSDVHHTNLLRKLLRHARLVQNTSNRASSTSINGTSGRCMDAAWRGVEGSSTKQPGLYDCRRSFHVARAAAKTVARDNGLWLK